MVNPEDLRGRKAPAFDLVDHNGNTFHFHPDHFGSPLVIFFFVGPGNNATTYQMGLMMQLYEQSQYPIRPGLRDSQNSKTLQVVGICPSKQKSLAEQANSRKLRFPLLSDPDYVVASSFGASRLFDRFVSKRASFVIDANGIVMELYTTPLAGVRSSSIDIERHIRCIEETLNKIG
ncbi:hypothetical protein CYLTODRAFT_411498 [Cylindrobasidium torrendii FP15055 ss-10]|uniref:Thioredoxin domain-containing protein n=1 Tax=Cylindrobasidium torrendii FP15055 ss-10 TaxID=1314674 RepID=A0A0D7B8L6_9AGAR|nr:hypothetical protein CYLTODRAFT_411498 [Cylindrobasidium torrendii FP15055 ss-10]